MIDVEPDWQRCLKMLQGLHPNADWVWKYTGPEEAQLNWKCRACKRVEKNTIDLVRLYRSNLPSLTAFTAVVRPISDSFSNHVCIRDLQQVVERLVQIILVCGHCWYESLDDTTKRFMMMELD